MLNNREPEFFINGVLNGDIAILSRAITLVESQNKTHQVLAQKIIDGVIPRTQESLSDWELRAFQVLARARL